MPANALEMILLPDLILFHSGNNKIPETIMAEIDQMLLMKSTTKAIPDKYPYANVIKPKETTTIVAIEAFLMYMDLLVSSTSPIRNTDAKKAQRAA